MHIHFEVLLKVDRFFLEKKLDVQHNQLLEKTESIMKRLIKMKHEKNQDLQNIFSPYGIDLEQFFTRVFQQIIISYLL